MVHKNLRKLGLMNASKTDTMYEHSQAQFTPGHTWFNHGAYLKEDRLPSILEEEAKDYKRLA